MDSVAQEEEEVFTLRLVLMDDSFLGPDDEFCNELNVTIIDTDSKY